MPDEGIEEVTEVVESDDPITAAKEEDLATEEATAASRAGPAAQAAPTPATPIEEGAGGENTEITDLKAELTRKTAELYKAQQQIQRIVPMIQRGTGTQSAGDQKVSPEQAEEVLKRFVNDPNGHMDGRIKEIVGNLLKAEIGPLRGELSASRADSSISSFMREHPELGKDAEEKIGKILDANPHLTQLGPNPTAARINASLEDALGRLIRQDPKGYAASLEASEKGPDQNIQNAKNAAGGLGNKGGSAVTTPQTENDPFDDVLDLNKRGQERFAAGIE